ncbi:hypothetical protein D3C87_332620 [compost metagenome]|jgi:histone H1/5
MAVIDETKKPAPKKAAAKPAAKPAAKAKAPAKKARVASITVPPAAQAKPAAKKPAVKQPIAKLPPRLAKIIEGFAKGGVTRSESLGGKITKAQKEVLNKEAARLGVTPAALVAALVINFLEACAAE